MLQEKRKAAILSFAAVYVVFGAMLVYLLFLNVGLAIDEKNDPITGLKKISVKNDSNRLIQFVSISYFDEFERKKEIETVDELFAGQEVFIDMNFPVGMNGVRILVEAPFHQTVEKTVSLGGRSLSLSYRLEMQDTAFKGFSFPIALSVCSDETEVKDVKVQESHETDFFEEQPGSVDIGVISSGGCKKVNFVLTPLKAGGTKIYFNVSVLNNSERIVKELEVKE